MVYDSAFGSLLVLSTCLAHSPAMASTLQDELVQAGFTVELWRLKDALAFLEVEEFTSMADLQGAWHVGHEHWLFVRCGLVLCAWQAHRSMCFGSVPLPSAYTARMLGLWSQQQAAVVL